jgi:hypothetical protein
LLRLVAWTATREFDEAYGSSSEFDALCKALQAGRDLDAYEVKLRLVSELSKEVRRMRAGRAAL